MYETLTMMKQIVTGKERNKSEIELINEYRKTLNPSILAYFYVTNFGMLNNISKKYIDLLSEDKASDCLQVLDNCLQKYKIDSEAKFTTYLYNCFNYTLNSRVKSLKVNKLNAYEILECREVNDVELEDYNLILNQYNLSDQEKRQCKLLSMGYTMKEIGKLFGLTKSAISQRNNIIKQKILNFS